MPVFPSPASFDDFSAPELVSLKNSLKQRGVKYVLASFVDAHGVSRGKTVPINHLEQMMRGSELFVGAAIDGMPQGLQEEDLVAVPDPNSHIICPWNSEIAWFASDLCAGGDAAEGCSRSVLKRVLGQAAGMGYRLNLGIETEFFAFPVGAMDAASGTTTPEQPLSQRTPYYDLSEVLQNYAWLQELVEAMNDLGWDVYSFDHEAGSGQFEIDFNYTDGLKSSDRFTFFRLMAQEIAKKHDHRISFMPKPFGDRVGSGAHFNLSLTTEGGENVFFSNDDPRGQGLSALGYQFIAGILNHAPALCAVLTPTVNSYKRLVATLPSGAPSLAPRFISYGNNRTNLLRIPLGGARVECRLPDSACNPYLAAAMLLSAGLEGIREGRDPGEPYLDDLNTYTPLDLQQKAIVPLPRTLGEAIDAFAADPLGYEVMGAPLFESFIELKAQEWETYTQHISAWEIQRYLSFF